MWCDNKRSYLIIKHKCNLFLFLIYLYSIVIEKIILKKRLCANYYFVFIGMQVNGSSNCSCWDGSETNIPSTMLLGQQTPQEVLHQFTGR